MLLFASYFRRKVEKNFDLMWNTLGAFMLSVIYGVGHVAAVSFWFKRTPLVRSGTLRKFVCRWREEVLGFRTVIVACLGRG